MSDDATVGVDPEIPALVRESAAAGLPDATTLPIAAGAAQPTAASPAWNVDPPAVADPIRRLPMSGR